jgi:23S rRNA (pseudouridine1915-N3)-methyltransferase
MKTELWLIGKTTFPYLEEGCKDYIKRLKRMTDFNVQILPDVKAGEPAILKEKEARMLLEKLKPDDKLILLDERGKSFSSTEWAQELQNMQMSAVKRVVFLVGGAYGFHEKIYERSSEMLSLSRMTFSHQLIRLIFLEQLYRGFTIINRVPYHHE